MPNYLCAMMGCAGAYRKPEDVRKGETHEGEADWMIVQRTSIFPASRDVVFGKLQKLETLQAIAKPWATFEPVGDVGNVWMVGGVSSYRFRLFGAILYGVHTIRIVRFDADGISSRESNARVPVWNHDIRLVPLDDSHTRYTDRVEIRAGWRTPFVWLWAKGFYAHRQRKWIELLEAEQ